MEGFDSPSLRSIRRLNRQVHDPISAWLGGMLASFVARVRPTVPEEYPPWRQDLYGFTPSDFPATKPPAERPPRNSTPA